MTSLAAFLGLLPVAGALLPGTPIDVALLIALASTKRWEYIRPFTYLINTTIAVTILSTTTTLFILLQVYRYVRTLQQPSSPCLDSGFPIKPLLFPCETAHVRMFPQTHGFKYSYLLVGIPVGWSGLVGGMVSSDVERVPHKSWYSRWLSLQPGSAWYTVNADDYLLRGHVEGGLKGKLDQYLESEGIEPSQYAHAYLLTAARFLGYASNPVSIWHLYSAKKQLAALILEVNNTFDEKRIYFLEPASSASSMESQDKRSSPRYTQTWPKDFYVSVFNSRNGSYSLSASDPLFPHMSKAGSVDITITLNNTSSSPKLVARVYSAAEALDPTIMSAWDKSSFLARWWWVGLATFPRTVKEALTLLMRKKMPWVFRPEPRATTISRKADETEVFIEGIFRRWLRERVEGSDEDVEVRYTSAGLLGKETEEEVMSSASAQLSDGAIDMEVKVLTPLFYSRVIGYDNIEDALWTESTESATVFLSPKIFTKLISSTSPTSTTLKHSKKPSRIPRIEHRYSILNLLRRRPPPIPVPTKERTTTLPISWSHGKGDSDRGQESFDAFVMASGIEGEMKIYFNRVSKLMSADLLAFGSLELLDVEIFLLKAAVTWVLVKLFL
ncbi:hypothetical protein WAI453_000012 [Rhynchosporium graminicola]|uniref:Cyclopropane-fatty-acyl-phospholipid synthase n=1 Tax=Rhynchosporium graminicola TaxID=2792576 RepID=A0A1E1K1I8_9HELO|nr:uncharacterized protein RCO7_11438 [Rhynchosporium commune]